MSPLIKELPEQEKPRERLLHYGANNLSNEELLAIILRTGCQKTSVKELASMLLVTVGNIAKLEEISMNKLAQIKGIGIVKAITIKASLELGKRVIEGDSPLKVKANNTSIIYNLFKNKWTYKNQEQLIAVYLDVKKQILSYKTIFIGTVDSSTVHPREIFKEALNLSASFVIIMHNHPSGNATPSKNDILFTKQIIETGIIMGIPLIDHIIFGDNSYTSYYENKW